MARATTDPSLPPWDRLFGGYDVRGRYPNPFSPRAGRALGYAIGHLSTRPFLIGRDVRVESRALSRALETGLRGAGRSVVSVGILPTPAVGFLGRSHAAFGLSASPSHNPLGFAGVKGFVPTGRIFGREWTVAGGQYEALRARGPGWDVPRRRTKSPSPRSRSAGWLTEYIDHLIAGRSGSARVVLDCRGGATAIAAPRALRAMGARVTEVSRGYSPTFFGRSAEPTEDDLRLLSRRVVSTSADVGFTFDGDGDRCVVVDEAGRPVPPEGVAVLLHRTLSPPHAPLVATVDASRSLDHLVRTVRSQVGSRHVTRTMTRWHSEVGVEVSGHYYVRAASPDSDGTLVACLIVQALDRDASLLRRTARLFAGLRRGTAVVEFPTWAEAREAFRVWWAGQSGRGTPVAGGVSLRLGSGWCVIRTSSTQPLIRLTFEAKSPRGFHALEREVEEIRASLILPKREGLAPSRVLRSRRLR